ncbi:unnamed protein product [Callosobruchus maculatus]|uniref:Uncharacterized protein n=1 Tax=Callosobruchus maculatus TaxID=64391 RepID=A0A653BIA0_CALMS|nr:unnamed protein product [Callosobruchus maculatus]
MNKIEAFKHEIRKVDWSIFSNHGYDSEYLANFLTGVFDQLIKLNFPLRKQNHCNKPPVNWFSDSLKNMRDTLSAIKTVAEVTKDFAAYKQYKSLYLKEIREAKKAANDNFLMRSDNIARDCWKIVNFGRDASRCKLTPNFSPNEFNAYFIDAPKQIVDSIRSSEINAANVIKQVSSPGNSFFDFNEKGWHAWLMVLGLHCRCESSV